MKLNTSIFLLILIATFTKIECTAQTLNRTQFADSLKKLSYFSIYKDNYFITGVPTNTRINSSTANAKYQISFKQIITKDKMPLNTYLFVTYTQKSFWNIYESSFPFSDINFNPTISLGKPIFNKKDELKGFATLSIEHESNGRDSIFSRTWNSISASYTTKLFNRTTANFKVWLPYGKKIGNPDLLEYVGLAAFHLEQELKPNKLYVNLMVRKGLSLERKGAIRSRVYYNPFKKNISNQYIMLEWYLGNAEGLLNYSESGSMIRIGYVIKSNEFNFFR